MVNNKFLKIILFPFSILYAIITFLRNKLFDFNIISSFSPNIYTINVGNLAVGGTGKTPHIEYVAKKLFEKYHIAILSRGYGRASKGFLEAAANTNAKLIGDEPFQYYLKFKEKLLVFVCENRVLGFKNIISKYPNINLLLLDDAFQHRNIKPTLNILLTEFGNLFTTDYLLPSGTLRESRVNAQRADAVIVTKCPDNLTNIQADTTSEALREIIHVNVPIFYSSVRYGLPTSYFDSLDRPKNNIIVVSAIANPRYFQEYCKANWQVQKCLQYADHHSFIEKDIGTFGTEFNDSISIFTTEKDYVKLKDLVPSSVSIFYIPIEINFINIGPLNFDSFLDQQLLKNKGNFQ